MPLPPPVSALARQTIRTACKDLERTITPADSHDFSLKTLQDVRIAALEIEKQLAARQSLCNMRRLMPLFRGLEHYSKVIDVLCNGTPYLPWIWAPITLHSASCLGVCRKKPLIKSSKGIQGLPRRWDGSRFSVMPSLATRISSRP